MLMLWVMARQIFKFPWYLLLLLAKANPIYSAFFLDNIWNINVLFLFLPMTLVWRIGNILPEKESVIGHSHLPLSVLGTEWCNTSQSHSCQENLQIRPTFGKREPPNQAEDFQIQVINHEAASLCHDPCCPLKNWNCCWSLVEHYHYKSSCRS